MLNESGVVFQSHMRACLGTEPSDLSSPSWDRIFLEAQRIVGSEPLQQLEGLAREAPLLRIVPASSEKASGHVWHSTVA